MKGGQEKPDRDRAPALTFLFVSLCDANFSLRGGPGMDSWILSPLTPNSTGAVEPESKSIYK